MKRLLPAALLAALVFSAALPAVSAAASGSQSDDSLQWARSHVERDIDMLQRDQRDYEGHRVKAIEAFQDSRNQLTVALTYDKYHDDSSQIAPIPDFGAYSNRSDGNLRYVRADVEHVIDVLQRDNTDYGGHRVDAISRLQQGREQIEAALQYDGNH